MKEKRLLNELGNVNDDFIEQAKPKIKNNRKRLYAVIGPVTQARKKQVNILPATLKLFFPSGKSSIASAMMYVLSSALSTATAKRKSTKAQPPTLSATKRLLN